MARLIPKYHSAFSTMR